MVIFHSKLLVYQRVPVKIPLQPVALPETTFISWLSAEDFAGLHRQQQRSTKCGVMATNSGNIMGIYDDLTNRNGDLTSS